VGDVAQLGPLAPATELSQVVAAGQYQVAVTVRGDEVVTPEGVDLAEGTVNFMYLIGARADGSLGWAAVKVPNASTPPAVIHTGDGSTTAGSDDAGRQRLIVGVVAVAAACCAVGGMGRARRSSQER
jgi:hypothetical protein